MAIDKASEPAKVLGRVRNALQSYRDEATLRSFLTDSFLDRMAIFGAALALWGAKVNLTARPRDPEESAFHIVDSLMPLVFAQDNFAKILSGVFTAGRQVLDIGSGAGFPGLILASACAADFTLAEARQKRASFLRVAAAEMALRNVQIRAVRIHPSSFASTFDVVMSRAAGPTPEFFQIAAGTLVPGGIAVLYASPSQRLDLASARTAGLAAYHRYRYTVKRESATVERTLAIWRKPEKAA